MIMDDDNIKQMKQILGIMANALVTDNIKTEMETLSDLLSCRRKVREKSSEFVSRYTDAVAKYDNVTSLMESATKINSLSCYLET